MNQTAHIKEDILFLVSPIGTLWRTYPYIEPPYGASLVVANLRKKGWGVTFVDLDLQLNHWQQKKLLLSTQTLKLLQDWRKLLEQLDYLPKDLNHLLERIGNFIQPKNYKYMAFSLSRLSKKTKVYDVEFGFALALARFIHSSNPCPVIFGGQNMSKIGRNSVERGIRHAPQKCADFFFYGDGAVSLPILMEALEDRKDHSELTDHLQKSKAHVTWWREPGRVVTLGKGRKPASRSKGADPAYTLERDLLEIRPSFDIANASLYPVSAKRIFPSANRAKWATRPISIIPYKFMYGCSHRCAFCKGAYQPVIVKPVAAVVDDLQYYVEKEGGRCFRFFNSQINYTRKYVEQFCNEVVRRDLKFHFIDSACLRNMDKNVCAMLREAGCVKLWFVLESPVEKILKLIDKRLSLDDALIATQYANEAGIWVGMNLILGFPRESDGDFEKIQNFIEDYGKIVDCWNFSALQVYEQTPMHDRPADYGITIHHHYRGKMRDKGFAFSEIDGLDWKARERRARKRVDDCQLLVGADENRFRTNDYLIFALYQEFEDKSLVKIHFDRFLDELGRSMSLADGSKWITPNKVLGFDSLSFLERMESRE